MIANHPRRGEIWIIDFHASRRSEQRGTRPALVIQNDVGNERAATTIVAALTTTIKLFPVTVLLKKGDGGIPETSMVNLSQLLTIDKKRLTRRVGKVGPEALAKVADALRVSLDIA